MAEKWIQKATAKRKGAFKAAAKREHMSTLAYAAQVLAPGSRASTRRKRQAILARIPMGRLGQVWDLFGAVIFLASAASDFVTGTVLYVDGGWTAA